jgi:phosphoserine phosphatase RsbU/P
MLGPTVAAYLYLDARGRGGHVAGDAAGFCQVIARLCGLAMVNIKRVEMEERQRRLESEVSAAREAQVLILPADRGEIGGLRYAMQMRPGRFVAGDLFDVIELGDNRIAVLIGDVTGDGVGAAMLMVAAQSHIHAALLQHGDAGVAVNIVNRYLAGRCGINKFISMWVGIFDLSAGRVMYVDAGHGHWLHKRASGGGGASVVRHIGGIPVGIDAGFEYHVEELAIARGDRIVLYSDGVVEQRSAEEEQFGRDRVIELINRSGSADQDVQTVIDAVDSFAGRSELDDDTTAASIEWVAE